jgi:hypothetical protein
MRFLPYQVFVLALAVADLCFLARLARAQHVIAVGAASHDPAFPPTIRINSLPIHWKSFRIIPSLSRSPRYIRPA